MIKSSGNSKSEPSFEALFAECVLNTLRSGKGFAEKQVFKFIHTINK